MKTKCKGCGAETDDQHMHYRTGLCQCALLDPDEHECTHGICDDCFYQGQHDMPEETRYGDGVSP